MWLWLEQAHLVSKAMWSTAAWRTYDAYRGIDAVFRGCVRPYRKMSCFPVAMHQRCWAPASPSTSTFLCSSSTSVVSLPSLLHYSCFPVVLFAGVVLYFLFLISINKLKGVSPHVILHIWYSGYISFSCFFLLFKLQAGVLIYSMSWGILVARKMLSLLWNVCSVYQYCFPHLLGQLILVSLLTLPIDMQSILQNASVSFKQLIFKGQTVLTVPP